MDHCKLHLNKVNNEVFITESRFPSFGNAGLEFLMQALPNSSKGRVRICAHKTTEDRQQEMFIAFRGDNYIRPSWHLGKDESLHVLRGHGQYLFFDSAGKIIDSVVLGEYDSDDKFYCRINESVVHALVIDSPDMAVHETTGGPFSRSDTVFADWSPEDAHTGVAAYLAELKSHPRMPRPLLKMKRQAEEVFVADEPIVSVGRADIEVLKEAVHSTTRKRVRLCAHTSTENKLHEMFVVYTDVTYVKPNLHLGKDESLHILEGEADFFFFDEKGEVIEVIPLGDAKTGREFYIRVPAHVYHTIVMKSERLVIHEVTPGPFVRSDTVWAPWAPDEADAAGVHAFMQKLQREAAARSR
jgi:cupin fold WbuC family metalloprotein